LNKRAFVVAWREFERVEEEKNYIFKGIIICLKVPFSFFPSSSGVMRTGASGFSKLILI